MRYHRASINGTSAARIMGQILLVRHGQASFGSSNYDQLSSRGEEQARLLGKWFAERGQRFDRIVTGSMMRHRQTAQACLGVMPDASGVAPWSEDSGFNEYDHDAVLHRYRPEFAEPGEVRRFIAANDNGNRVFQQIFQDAMARWMGGQHDAEYQEPWPAFRARCVAALQRLAASAGASQTAIVFTSGGTIATLCQHVLQMPDPQMFTLNWTLVNSAVTKLYYRAPVVQEHDSDASAPSSPHLTLGYLNNYAHLEVFGDAQAVTYR
jgi:broad specificity phosphatase PhoE